MKNYENTFKKLENHAIGALKENLHELMAWNRDREIKINNKREITKKGSLKVTVMGEIDLMTAMKSPYFVDGINSLFERQVTTALLEYFITDDTKVFHKMPDNMSFEEATEILGKHYTTLHGRKEWQKAMSVISSSEPKIHCYSIFSIEYYPVELAKQNKIDKNTTMRNSLAIDSELLNENDNNGHQPFAIWFKNFLKGNAGKISKDYIIKRNMALQRRM